MNILITGSANGIGREVSIALAEAGHTVFGLDIDKDNNNTVNDDIDCDFGEFHPVLCDVRDLRDLRSAAEKFAYGIGPEKNWYMDVIINNAGVNRLDWIENITEDDWDYCFDTNAKSIFNTTQAFLGHLNLTNGTIINILSNAADRPMTNSLIYNASKAAAKMMTLQMARELRPQGISVFGISPNKIKGTRMSEYVDRVVPKLRGWTPEYAKAYEAKNLPAGETPVGTIADYFRYILSSKCRFKHLTGTIIPFGY